MKFVDLVEINFIGSSIEHFAVIKKKKKKKNVMIKNLKLKKKITKMGNRKKE